VLFTNINDLSTNLHNSITEKYNKKLKQLRNEDIVEYQKYLKNVFLSDVYVTFKST
jgi:hypothetical protein